MRLYGEREKKRSAPATNAAGAGLSFQRNKWGKGEKGIACSMCWAIFARYFRPENNDKCSGKKKRLVPTASTADTCLSVVRVGNAPVPNVPRHLHQVNCFQEGMLEFDREVGGGGKRKKARDRQQE